jgi:hypothetical protein
VLAVDAFESNGSRLARALPDPFPNRVFAWGALFSFVRCAYNAGFMAERIHFGSLKANVADVIDAGIDVLPHFEMAAISVLEHMERPGEWPEMRRRLRAEGVRLSDHRGVLLLTPGDLERLSSVGILSGGDEIYLMAEWNDEFESFPGRMSGEAIDLAEGTPLGLDEWMLDAGCILALGDGPALNFATADDELAERLTSRFPVRRV